MNPFIYIKFGFVPFIDLPILALRAVLPSCWIFFYVVEIILAVLEGLLGLWYFVVRILPQSELGCVTNI